MDDLSWAAVIHQSIISSKRDLIITHQFLQKHLSPYNEHIKPKKLEQQILGGPGRNLSDPRRI